MKILAIIPAYNEEENIELLLNKLKMSRVDVLVINDNSIDSTSEICKRHAVNVIDLPCNLGIGGAVQTGYKYAKNNNYEIAIQVDGDGQHDPRFIDVLIEPLINGKADMVIGSRYINKNGFQSTYIRRIGIRYFSLLIKQLTRKGITDPTSGFRACNSKVINEFSMKYPVDYPEPESIVYLLRKNYRVAEIPVIMKERIGGVSSIGAIRSVYYMIKVTLAIFIDILRGREKSEVL